MYIRAVLYVERDSQKRILIGAGGQRIRDIGRAAREKIEAFVGAPVYLDLWVKVLPNWRRRATARSAASAIDLPRTIRMTLSPQLLAILVCPKCKGELEYREAESIARLPHLPAALRRARRHSHHAHR